MEKTREKTTITTTKKKLISLAKYWAEIAFEIERKWYQGGKLDSWEIHLHLRAWQRLEAIRDICGDEVDIAVQKVHKEYAEKCHAEDWQNFLFAYESEGQWHVAEFHRRERERKAKDEVF